MSEELFDDVEQSEYAEEMDQIQLVGVKLGDEEYAIDVLKINTIIRSIEITIVPRMESYILGVMNLRGKVVPVIDLRVRFNLAKNDFDKATRIIVVNINNENIGFVVDEVTEVMRIKRSMVEPTPPLVGSIGQEYILGICKYDSRLIMLLDIDRVINESEASESELRKKMLGSTKQTVLAPIAAPEPAAERADAGPTLFFSSFFLPSFFCASRSMSCPNHTKTWRGKQLTGCIGFRAFPFPGRQGSGALRTGSFHSRRTGPR